MGKIVINNKLLEKYFGLLNRLDNAAKKKLIWKLEQSLEWEQETFDLQSLFGAWQDERETDDIIKEIRNARVNKRESEGFE